MIKNDEWWDSLSDIEKFQAYKSMKAANESHANALNAVTDHLLGKDWLAMDLYGVNEEIVAAIKDKYPNVNYNWSWEKIKNAVWDHFKR